MDSNGNLYANEEFRKLMEKEFGDTFKPMEAMPADGLGFENEEIAKALAAMNHHARRIYFSERRRGQSEQAALDAARNSLPR